VPVIQEQSEYTAQSVGKVCSKQSTDQTEEVVEVWNRLCDDPSDDPDGQSDSCPCKGAGFGSSGHVNSASEATDEDVLAGDMTIDDSRNDDLPCVRFRDGEGRYLDLLLELQCPKQLSL
jgi:hypothetical protein